MKRLMPIYEDEPGKLASLNARLEQVLDGIDRPDGDEPVQHAAHFNDDWDFVLKSSGSQGLLGASAIRRGTERYDFERAGDTDWSLASGNTMFGSAQFHNLVHMATEQGLEWTEVPQAK